MVSLPTEVQLDEGYIFGRDHCAKVSVSTIQPPEGPLTNQRLLNIIHAREVYELLKSDAHHDVSYMTLRPISYLDRTNDDGSGGEAVRFDGSGCRTKFLDELERWKVKVGLNDENWKERAGEFLEDVTWEPVDGQHILHACQEFAPVEVGQVGGTSEEVFADQFLRRLAYTIVYDDPVFYVHESHRLNAHHFVRRKFATVGETMRKMRELWEHYGKPIGTNEDRQRRVAFLACLLSILSTRTLAKQGEVSVKDIAVAFQDWLPHVQQEWVEDLEAMLAVCTDYDTGRDTIFYRR